MTFEIYRTSDWFSENPPCEGAKQVRAGSVTDHPVYEIEIDTLEQLLKLVKKEGDVIITESDKDKTGNEFNIEIYDDYIYDDYRE